MAYDPWNAYALHEEEQTAGAAEPSVPAVAAVPADEGDRPEQTAHSAVAETSPDADSHARDDESEPISSYDETALSRNHEIDDGEIVRSRAPDAAALLTAVGRVMDVLETERRQIEVLRDERRVAEQEREQARIVAARLEAELEAERMRREAAEVELMKAQRDLYGDEARLRAARLEALVEMETARREDLQRELGQARAQLEASSVRRRWWQRG